MLVQLKFVSCYLADMAAIRRRTGVPKVINHGLVDASTIRIDLGEAWFPAGDPFVLNPTFTGKPDLANVNPYLRCAVQPVADDLGDASTTTYCSHVREIATDTFQIEQHL